MKKALLLCSILLIIYLQAEMVIRQNCQITFGPRDISINGGITIDRSNVLKKSPLIKFNPSSTIQFIGSEEDTMKNLCILNNVIVNKSKGNISLEQDLNVLGQLQFINGNIDTGRNTLCLASPTSAVSGERSDAMVIGNLKSERYIGSGNSSTADHFGGIGLRINNPGNDIGAVSILRKTSNENQEWKIETSIPFTGTRNVSVYWNDSERRTADFDIDKATTLTVDTDAATPQYLSMIINSNITKLTWSQVKGAVKYKVYSSTDPFGTFVLDETGCFNGAEWTAPLTETRKFYYVTAINKTDSEPSEITSEKRQNNR